MLSVQYNFQVIAALVNREDLNVVFPQLENV